MHKIFFIITHKNNFFNKIIASLNYFSEIVTHFHERPKKTFYLHILRNAPSVLFQRSVFKIKLCKPFYLHHVFKDKFICNERDKFRIGRLFRAKIDTRAKNRIDCITPIKPWKSMHITPKYFSFLANKLKTIYCLIDWFNYIIWQSYYTMIRLNMFCIYILFSCNFSRYHPPNSANISNFIFFSIYFSWQL